MPASVLIVDSQPETREVLRALVERAGAIAIEAHRPEEALVLAAADRPDLILLDLDSDLSKDHCPGRDLQAQAGRMATPIVVLGTSGSDQTDQAENAEAQFVAKPYHYGPLVRRIEDLLAARSSAQSSVGRAA